MNNKGIEQFKDFQKRNKMSMQLLMMNKERELIRTLSNEIRQEPDIDEDEYRDVMEGQIDEVKEDDILNEASTSAFIA